MQQQFLIRIKEHDFALDSAYETFHLRTKAQNTGSSQIPLHRFRVQAGNWYILWDRRTNSFYKPQLNIYPFPLTVEWVQAEIVSADSEEKDRIALLILLSEAIETVRQQKTGLRKSDINLHKALEQFSNKNNY